MKKGFTLLELLVVIAIISLLIAGAAVSYSQFTKQARDAKRKADMDNIRAALEQYRSTNDVYPTSIPLSSGLQFGTSSLTDGTNTYMGLIPQDPKSPTSTYYYSYVAGGSDYTLGSTQEGTSSCSSAPPAGSCTTNCNYCLGAYGRK